MILIYVHVSRVSESKSMSLDMFLTSGTVMDLCTDLTACWSWIRTMMAVSCTVRHISVDIGNI